MYAPSQWEMTLQCNIVLHWLGIYTKWSLQYTMKQGSYFMEYTLTGHQCQSFQSASSYWGAHPSGHSLHCHYCGWTPCMFGCSGQTTFSDTFLEQKHFMITSSNGDIFRVTGHLCGEFTVPRWIPRTKASDTEFWCFFFCLRLNKPLSKQWWCWWFKRLSRPLWRHCNGRWLQILPVCFSHRICRQLKRKCQDYVYVSVSM